MNHISYQLALAHRDELLRQAAYSRLAKHAAQVEPSSRVRPPRAAQATAPAGTARGLWPFTDRTYAAFLLLTHHIRSDHDTVTTLIASITIRAGAPAGHIAPRGCPRAGAPPCKSHRWFCGNPPSARCQASVRASSIRSSVESTSDS